MGPISRSVAPAVSASVTSSKSSGRRARALTVAAVALVELPIALQGEQRLHLAHDLPARGVLVEHLPDKAPEGAVQGKGALARGRRRLEGRCGDEAADGRFDLAEGALPQGRQRLRPAPAETGEAGAQRGKKRRVCHRAVYIPLY